jgi:Retinal pigment epithelial membrane protein
VLGKDGGVANTNIVWHAGRLFALEEGQRPFALNPQTLEAQGYWDFAGAFKGARFTAHPKIDPETGEMIFFAYSAAGHFSPTLGYGVIDSTGKLTRPAVPLRPVLRLRGPLVRFRRGGLWRTDGPAAGATGSGRAPQSAGAPVPAVSFAEISKYVEQNAEKLKATARFARIGRGFTTHTLE